MTEYVPPHVISVLKTYQDKAPRSLHGPGLSLVHPSKASGGGGVVGRAETPDLPHHAHHHGVGEQAGGGRSAAAAAAAAAGSDGEELVMQPSRHQPMGPPVPGVPIMTTPDPDCGMLQMTILEGKRIGCFLLGGETRLCLPQIFNNILMDFSVEQINRCIQELMIYLYNCTDQQLAEFKRANIIPDSAKSCGLITRTNAERLCSSLLHQAHELRPRLKGGSGGAAAALLNGSFRVYHRCFGKGEGLFLPELYSYEEPTCIECAECRGLFSPQKFVCHQHEPQEIRTCHWGFNSSNWRSYIHVAECEKGRDEHAQVLDKIWLKEREIEQELECERAAIWIARRKVAFEDGGPITIKAEPLDIPIKKPKLMSDHASLYHSTGGSSSGGGAGGSSRAQHYAAQQLLVHPQSHLLHHHQQQQQQTSAAFRPWTAQQKKYAQQQQQALLLQQIAPYANGTTTAIVNGTIRPTSPGGSILTLSQEPPLLQNPENVVPMSETDKFERSYQPNVALVPRKSILCGKEPSSAVSVTPVQRRAEYDGKDRSVIKCEMVQIKQESPATPPATTVTGGTDGAIRSVIKCDVQIKQERPGTPPPTMPGHLVDHHGGRGGGSRGENSRSPGPPSSAHIPVSPPPTPAGTSHSHPLAQSAIAISTIIAKQQQQQQLHHHHHHQQVSSYGGGSNSNSPVPIALDVQHSGGGSSGSNEITSSTSPMPPSSILLNMNGGDGVVVRGEEARDKPKLVLIKEPISPPLSTRTPTGRHSPHGHMLQQQQQQQQGGGGHHSQPVSSPPSSHHSEHHQPLYLHHHQVLQQQQQQQQHFRSHHPGTTSTTPSGTIIHRNGHPIVGNSEFELSTDTDDDSQTGEPDSSNVPTTMELIGEVLKEVESETKQQILDIFKVLLQESRVEHHRLQMEIRAKEDQLMEMQRHKMELQRQTDHFQQQIHQLQHELNRALLKIDSLRGHHQHQLSQQHHLHQQQQHHIMARETLGGVGESTTSSTPPSPLSLVSNGSNSNHSHQLIERRNSFPEKSEIITKPLKKLLRRSPDDATTVLMLASPPPQPTGSLPPSLPACLSITATTVPVPVTKASSAQPDTEMGDGREEERDRRQQRSSTSDSPSPAMAGVVGGVLQSAATAPQQPPPTSATNVPASPTTIMAVSAVNGGPSPTAPSITKPSSGAENGPPPSPTVVVIPVHSSGPLPKEAAGGCTPRPSSRDGSPVSSPRSDGKGRCTPVDAKDNGDDEDVPMEDDAPPVTDSPSTVDGKSDSSSSEEAAKVSISVAKGVTTPTIATGSSSSSSASSGGASNQENDSPNRSQGGSGTGGVSTKSSCDN